MASLAGKPVQVSMEGMGSAPGLYFPFLGVNQLLSQLFLLLLFLGDGLVSASIPTSKLSTDPNVKRLDRRLEGARGLPSESEADSAEDWLPRTALGFDEFLGLGSAREGKEDQEESLSGLLAPCLLAPEGPAALPGTE